MKLLDTVSLNYETDSLEVCIISDKSCESVVFLEGVGVEKKQIVFAFVSMSCHSLSLTYTPTAFEYSIFMCAFMTVGDCLNELAR
jgi:hypothetical protein